MCDTCTEALTNFSISWKFYKFCKPYLNKCKNIFAKFSTNHHLIKFGRKSTNFNFQLKFYQNFSTSSRFIFWQKKKSNCNNRLCQQICTFYLTKDTFKQKRADEITPQLILIRFFLFSSARFLICKKTPLNQRKINFFASLQIHSPLAFHDFLLPKIRRRIKTPS